MNIQIEHGCCLEVMARLREEGVQVDSVVTDPPYHLVSIVNRFGKDNSAPAKSNGATGVYGRAATGFMGQTWDGGDVAFRPETWRLAFDLLKPGGHMLVFGGTRTYHRLACAIEDAGFEIRDQIQWLYGSGFPKSHDVSKGIDKRRTEDGKPVRVVCRYIRDAMDAQGLKSRHLVEHFDDCHPRLIDHWAARDTDSQPNLPTWEQWLTLKRVLNLCDDMDAEVWRLNGRKGDPGDAYQNAEILGEHEGALPGLPGERFTARDAMVRAPATDASKEWEGWGTALKPACEPIVLARKPLDGTVAGNVLQHGTGALNIDRCRVENEENRKSMKMRKRKEDLPGSDRTNAIAGMFAPGKDFVADIHPKGRWPANVIHDGSEEVLAAFAVSGKSKSTIGKPRQGPNGDGWGMTATGAEYGDQGTAARFFYSSKADKTDRLGSKHPTVKPVDLIAYLCRLITPPGGLVLDPFAGSGTTAMACLRESFNAIVIEKEARFVKDIRRRIAHVEGADTPLFAEGRRNDDD